jgi:hypothetical protein
MKDDDPGAIHFKLGGLGVTKLFSELDATNTLAEWIRPPEARDPSEYGPLDRRIDIYHLGLLFLQLAYSREIRFTADEIMAGRPREMALELPMPLALRWRSRFADTPRSGRQARKNSGVTSSRHQDCQTAR